MVWAGSIAGKEIQRHGWFRPFWQPNMPNIHKDEGKTAQALTAKDKRCIGKVLI